MEMKLAWETELKTLQKLARAARAVDVQMHVQEPNIVEGVHEAANRSSKPHASKTAASNLTEVPIIRHDSWS